VSDGPVSEFRLALTVDDFDAALAFYRDALGLPQLEAWESADGRVVILDAGRATLELLDPRHAAAVDEIEVGRRAAGSVRVALQSRTRRRRPTGWWIPAPSGLPPRWSRRGATGTSASRRRTGCS
jgi:catechol 2,3-dioxygenase-like lactoylglutathione lyase family enzyme